MTFLYFFPCHRIIICLPRPDAVLILNSHRRRSPLHRPKKLPEWLRRLRLSEVNIYSAYASFFIVLSMFPAMMLAVSLLPYTPVTERELQTILQRVVPASLEPLLDYLIDELFAVNSAAALSHHRQCVARHRRIRQKHRQRLRRGQGSELRGCREHRRE